MFRGILFTINSNKIMPPKKEEKKDPYAISFVPSKTRKKLRDYKWRDVRTDVEEDRAIDLVSRAWEDDWELAAEEAKGDALDHFENIRGYEYGQARKNGGSHSDDKELLDDLVLEHEAAIALDPEAPEYQVENYMKGGPYWHYGNYEATYDEPETVLLANYEAAPASIQRAKAKFAAARDVDTENSDGQMENELDKARAELEQLVTLKLRGEYLRKAKAKIQSKLQAREDALRRKAGAKLLSQSSTMSNLPRELRKEIGVMAGPRVTKTARMMSRPSIMPAMYDQVESKPGRKRSLGAFDVPGVGGRPESGKRRKQ